MSELSIADFEAFYEAVHGQRPFLWQSEFIRQVYENGKWPDLVDLPTGAGKTSLIDIAVFLLALDADRRFARRIVMVVDRRTIVDQAADRGSKIRTSLMQHDSQVLAAVADRLRALFGGDSNQPPLVAGVMRGGIVRDETWAERPDVPAVIASTVDQVGSRLLFRGYGVSENMRPIHAGLLGNDTLFLLDEVHLSQPFAATLGRLARYRDWSGSRLSTPWQVVELSATPRTSQEHRRFPPSRDVVDNDPALAPRLNAAKPATLRLIKGSADETRDRRQLVAVAIDEVDQLLEHDHVRMFGIVVNRVQTATAVATQLKERGDLEVVLLTGRMRPYDRDDVLGRYRNRLISGRQRSDDEPRLAVVATQSIEAGADFDLDGLITECASLDALRQRFGRVDRMGWLSLNGTPSVNIVITTSSQVAPGARDPVYGKALAETWRWLQDREPVDFGLRRLPDPDAAERERLLPPADRAPVLLPAHLDAWAQTRPAPQPDHDVALWLHGIERTVSKDVAIVWRADLTEAFLAGRDPEDNGRPLAADLLATCPPVSGEALAVPIGACAGWLRRDQPIDVAIADSEATEAPTDRSRISPVMRPALRWDADGVAVINDPNEIKPGDTLVVPSSYGGLTLHSWDPTSTEPVSDLGHVGQYKQRHRAVVRLLPTLLPALASHSVPYPPDNPDQEDADPVEWLKAHQDEFGGVERAIVEHLLATGTTIDVDRFRAPAFSYDETNARWEAASRRGPSLAYVISTRRPIRADTNGDIARLELPDVEDDITQLTGKRVLLADHLDAVRNMAEMLATHCGVPAALVNDLALAGQLHDLGKADPRFQVILYGDELEAAVATELLAKSGVSDISRREHDRLRRASGYPPGMRHELLSVAMIHHHPRLDAAHDRDLVLHLVGSHHGWCRPFAPPVVDREPSKATAIVNGEKYEASSDHGLARLDSGVADRFWRLVRRYGWYGLAWLEAILRLADHRSSERHALGARSDGN